MVHLVRTLHRLLSASLMTSTLPPQKQKSKVKVFSNGMLQVWGKSGGEGEYNLSKMDILKWSENDENALSLKDSNIITGWKIKLAGKPRILVDWTKVLCKYGGELTKESVEAWKKLRFALSSGGGFSQLSENVVFSVHFWSVSGKWCCQPTLTSKSKSKQARDSSALVQLVQTGGVGK